MELRKVKPVRTTPRVVTDIEATWSAHGQHGRAFLYNISMGGCMFESAKEAFFPGDVLALQIPSSPTLSGSVVWQIGQFCGMRFHQPIAAATVEELGFKEPLISFEHSLPRDRFGRTLPILSGQLPF